MTQTDIESQDRIGKKEGFANWKDQPATRMLMSMIPQAEKPEILETLLQETFNAGYAAGAGKTAATFLEAMFKGMDKGLPRRD